RQLVQNALQLGEQQRAQAQRSANKLLGNSEAMVRLRETLAKVARSQAQVYISGESGTGKELAARLIHEQGPRSSGNFVPVNCGAIPSELMESEFFGHKKGSFTGAQADKEGLFQAADGGTLFLDEVAELPLHMQVKPLRVRPEDIPVLADAILRRLASEAGIAPVKLAPDAIEALSHYRFPGNVRELENILERAVAFSEGDAIAACDLHLPGAKSGHAITAIPAEGETPQPAPAPTHTAGAQADNGNVSLPSGEALPDFIENL